MKSLEEGTYYTVIDGRFKGITAVAVEAMEGSRIVHCLYSPDFGNEAGIISFFGSFDSLRKSTVEEELALRRRIED